MLASTGGGAALLLEAKPMSRPLDIKRMNDNLLNCWLSGGSQADNRRIFNGRIMGFASTCFNNIPHNRAQVLLTLGLYLCKDTL